jgi:hypothetical protein
MDWSKLASLAPYIPFFLTEAAKHPTVSTWLQQCLATCPTKDVIQVIGDVQKLADEQHQGGV